MLWRAMEPPCAARAVLPPSSGASTPTDGAARGSEAQGTASVLGAMRERGFCGGAETHAAGRATSEGYDAEMRARLLSKLAELLDALRPPLPPPGTPPGTAAVTAAGTAAAPPPPPAPESGEGASNPAPVWVIDPSTGLAVQASTAQLAQLARAAPIAAAPRGITSYPRRAEDATSDATVEYGVESPASNRPRPATAARADGGPGASRALVLKAWVAVASHGVQQSALRRLIAEASAGCHPTSAALLEQLHAMHVAALLPSAASHPTSSAALSSAGYHPTAPAPRALAAAHALGPGGLAAAMAPSAALAAAPAGEWVLEGTAAAERAAGPEPAAFAEYAGCIIDECSRRVLAASSSEAPLSDERERERGNGSGGGGERGQGSGRGGGPSGRGEQGELGGRRAARLALRAGARLHDDPVVTTFIPTPHPPPTPAPSPAPFPPTPPLTLTLTRAFTRSLRRCLAA